IDHHSYRHDFGDITLANPRASAVGEIIYRLLLYLGIKMDKKIAQNILTSIVVETNSFRLPNVGVQTFKICAELLSTGVDFHLLSETVYWSQSKESIALKGICLGRVKFLKKGKIVWSLAGKEDFRITGAGEEDADSVPNDMLSIEGVEMAVFFRETRRGVLRVSLRSKGGVNVARFARRYKGGGHFDVAGCFIPYNEKSLAKFLKSAERVL
ncbi:MAG: hypothetical protein GF375_07305, partial [Candidatus Omnitrophica bacterium]|nr:hypothetical protein [Candidatus Omnitrophota bacterium]